MGLTTDQFLSMDLWQFNAYSVAWKARMRDVLAIEIQGAWLNAYWNSSKKHKMSLRKVLRELEDKQETEKPKIDKVEVEKTFKQFEELQKYGWTQS